MQALRDRVCSVAVSRVSRHPATIARGAVGSCKGRPMLSGERDECG